MMKILIPLILAIAGLGAGVGAGLMLKPAPEVAASGSCGEDQATVTGADGEAVEPAAAEDCETQVAGDPFDGEPAAEGEAEEVLTTFVPFEKPFVVPVFEGEKIAAMVVVSLSVETGEEAATVVTAMEPRLRDRFLKVFFLHSNSGGFNGSFTSGRKMTDLKSALLKAAKEVMRGTEVNSILVTEIARQDI